MSEAQLPVTRYHLVIIFPTLIPQIFADEKPIVGFQKPDVSKIQHYTFTTVTLFIAYNAFYISCSVYTH